MKIYTRTGDQGQTRIFADKPIKMAKSATELHCYGTLDELNSQVGLLISLLTNQHTPIQQQLVRVQRQLFEIGFAISAQGKISQGDIDQLEAQIDEMTAQLPPQTSFILPGGGSRAAHAHICRTITRRAERYLTALQDDYTIDSQVAAYLNRLSDYFFVLARYANFLDDVSDTEL